MGPTKNPPRYAITGSIALGTKTAYIILKEEDNGHGYGVAVHQNVSTASQSYNARYFANFVGIWHRSVQGAMDEANKLRA